MYRLFMNAHITTGEVASLQHELRDDSVELAALVAVSLLASAQSSEVLGSLGNNVVVEGKVDATFLGCNGTPSAGAIKYESSSKVKEGKCNVVPQYDEV